MEQSMGKITWGYIWRLVVWYILIAFVVEFIFRLALVTISGGLGTSIDATISYNQKYLIGTLIIGLLNIVISCKLATSGIKKTFSIDENASKKVFKCVVIVLIVLTVLISIYNIFGAFELRNELEEYSEQMNNYYDLLQSYTGGDISEDLAKVEGFLDFCNVYVIVSLVLNIVVLLLMIPFEKKLLKA